MSRGQAAWLVMWEWSDSYAEVEDRLAAILRPRTSIDAIQEILRCLYSIHVYTPTEQALWSKRPGENPYKPGWTGKYLCICGHNPSLIAQYVRGLFIDIDPDSGLETFRYLVPAEIKVNSITKEKKILREERRESFTRTITGTLSSREIGRQI